jgi:redox-sensitive bicupin YhaK (pirin superfamily)
VVITAGERGASLLLAAGKPFGEPIVQSGPFVMSTEEEIQRAYYDYQRGTLGRD